MTEKTVAGITKEEYESYEHTRASGITNMFAFSVVEEYSGLSLDKQIAIVKNFDELMETWPDVREN